MTNRAVPTIPFSEIPNAAIAIQVMPLRMFI